MTKEIFRKKWYYRPLRILFWGSLVFLSGALILIGLTDDDIPVAGFFWAGVVAFAFWLVKKVLYYVLFRESIFPRGSK